MRLKTPPREVKLAASANEKRDDMWVLDPYRVHSPWWSNKNNFHREWSQCRQAPRHALTGPLEHGGAA